MLQSQCCNEFGEPHIIYENDWNAKLSLIKMAKRNAPLRSLNSGRDEYEVRLKELFDESDESDKGYLNTNEVHALCLRLQLGRLKDKVIRSLKERSVNKDKVQYVEFRHVFFSLLEDLEAQQNKSPRKSAPNATDEPLQIRPDQSPKAAPKLILGRKQYGRRSMPFKIESDVTSSTGAPSVKDPRDPALNKQQLQPDSQDSQQPLRELLQPPEGSYMQFLRDLDSNDRSSPSVDVVSRHVKRRKQARQESNQMAATNSKVMEETYEAEGVLPTEEDVGLPVSAADEENSDAGNVLLQQLRDLCRQNSLPESGSLNLPHFAALCVHIGLDGYSEGEIEELFYHIDKDKDGLISLQDIMLGLPKSSPFHFSSSSTGGLSDTVLTSTTRLGASSRRSMVRVGGRSRSSSRTRHAESLSGGGQEGEGVLPPAVHFFLSSDFAGMFSTLEHDHDGFAQSEDIIDFWDKIGVISGAEILKNLGYNPRGKVKLSDLTSSLSEELANSSSPELLRSAALLSFQQEIKNLKYTVEQAYEEKKKLRLDLSESTARNALLAREVDDRHAQLDKSWEMKLINVERKYQEQTRQLQMELDREREAGAAQAARLRAQLEELQAASSKEEIRLAEKVAADQKEIKRLETDLSESASKLRVLSKQHEELKKDINNKHLELAETSAEVPETNKAKVQEMEQILARKQEENKRLQDYNDELLAKIEEIKTTKQTNKGQLATLPMSRIPVLRKSSNSSAGASEEDEPASAASSARGHKSSAKLNKQQWLAMSTPSLNTNYSEGPSLSRELNQLEFEKERKEQKKKFDSKIKELLQQHEQETQRLLSTFENEKDWLIEEQKIKEETVLADQARELSQSHARQIEELARDHRSEVKNLQQNHEEEMKSLQERFKEAESNLHGNEKLEHIVENLETELARCHQDIFHLSSQKADLDLQLRQQEVNLRAEFDRERENLADRFSRELEQRQASHRQQVEGLFAKGFEGLSGKIRDDFLSLVRKHTEEEVGHSQAAILNQLHRDRSGLAAALEQEKSNLYEEAEQHKIALAEKYEAQIRALRQELAQIRGQLEAEKQSFATAVRDGQIEAAQKGGDMVNKLKKDMEEELLIELRSIKESFESEKRELETQKTLLEEELAEMQVNLDAERKKTADMTALKENLKCLKAEKREVENMAEGMKEKLYQAYQQKGAEQSDVDVKVQTAMGEGHCQGEKEGYQRGRLEGLAQGKQDGYAEGFVAGRHTGIEQGRMEVGEESNTTKYRLEEQINALRQDNSNLDKCLQQEKEHSIKLNQMAQGRDQLKHSFDQLLAEKDLLTSRFDDAVNQLTAQHQEEKEMLKEEIAHLEEQRLNAIAESTASMAQLAALKQEIARQAQSVDREMESPRVEEHHANIPQSKDAIQDEMEQLKFKLQEAEVAQKGLDLLKYHMFLTAKTQDEREKLIQEKCDLEDTVRKLRSRTQEEESSKIKSQEAEINALNEEKQKLRDMLDQSSDQLMKASTSMALAQSKFLRQLEEMKRQPALSEKDFECYTQLQISLLEHQRLVIVLQDTLRERETLVRTVIEEHEEALNHMTQVNEAKVREIQEKLDWTHDMLVKQTEKYNNEVEIKQRRSIVLKDIYVEKSELMKTLAQNELELKKLKKKCASYKKTFHILGQTMEESVWTPQTIKRSVD